MRNFVSTLFPRLKDPQDSTEVRKSLLDLMTTVNSVAANRRFGDTDTGNYTEFGTNGFQTAAGTAVCWNDIIIPATSFRFLTAPTFAQLIPGIYAYRFDAGTADTVYSSFEVPHDYKQGTDIDIHVHWCPTTTDTGDVYWNLQYVLANVGDTFTTTGGNIAKNPAPGVINKHVLQDLVTIPGLNLKIGAVIPFSLQRGGLDPFLGNAFVLSVGAHYQSDTLGSRLETTK